MKSERGVKGIRGGIWRIDIDLAADHGMTIGLRAPKEVGIQCAGDAPPARFVRHHDAVHIHEVPEAFPEPGEVDAIVVGIRRKRDQKSDALRRHPCVIGSRQKMPQSRPVQSGKLDFMRIIELENGGLVSSRDRRQASPVVCALHSCVSTEPCALACQFLLYRRDIQIVERLVTTQRDGGGGARSLA